MPIIRTVFRPWEELEVPDTEAAALAAMGLVAPDVVEEVNSSGSSEEGGGEEGASGLQRDGEQDLPQGGRQPRRRASNPRVPDAQSEPGGQEGQPGTEEGPTKEGEVTA